MLWKCCTHYASKFGKLRSGHRTEKCVFIPIPKNGNVTECSSYHRIVLISYYSEVMLKILQARLYQSVNQDLPDVHVWFRKGRRIRDQTINIHGIIQKAREFQGEKKSTSASVQFSQLLSHVRLFATPWITACQASLSITTSWSLLKLMPWLPKVKTFDSVDNNKLWKILKEMGIADPPYLPLEKSVYRSRRKRTGYEAAD